MQNPYDTHDIAQQKQLLRKLALDRRAAIPPQERARRSAALCHRLLGALALPAPAGGSIALYEAVGSEVSLDVLAAELTARGYRLAYPAIIGEGVMTFYAIDSAGKGSRATALLKANPFARLDPQQLDALCEVSPDELRALVVPVVVFDARGYRIGYGGGFYDRYLAQLPPETPRYGVAFSEQATDRIPRAEHDIPMSSIVSA